MFNLCYNLLCRSVNRASVCTCATVDALVSVDNVCVCAFGNSLYRALGCASTTANASICVDFVSHNYVLLL